MLFRRTRLTSGRHVRLQVESLESRLAPHAGVHDLATLVGEPHSGGSRGGGDNVSYGDNPSLLVPAYSSLPGAAASLYLDFNGHFEATWGSYANVDTPPYDTDGIPTAFSTTELANIQKIWQYVAEDYAPFKINVTTVLPASFANGAALRVAIGGGSAWAGGTYGGIAYINSFTSSIVNTVYVFPAHLGNGAPRYVADATSHESGHAFGLQHQSLWNGSTKTEYQTGPGDGTAPILGNSYSATRSLWWYGSTTSATTYQDDMAVIASTLNGFGYRLDDHGNTAATASPLSVSGTGAVSGSGLIERTNDLDVFSFTAAAGTLTLTADVAEPYNNLDVRLELRDSNDALVASANPTTSFDATITATVVAGNYRLVVASAGPSSAATATNYGFNIGQYSLSGSIGSTTGNPPSAPTNLTAAAASSSQINLSWTDNASNESGYRVERLDGSVWTQVAELAANTTAWQNTGLAANTSYSYRVRAYNADGNSAYSNTASATTPAAPSAPAAPSGLTGASKNKPTLRINLAWTDNATNESGFRLYRSSDGGTTWSQLAALNANTVSYSDTSVTKGTSYRYRILAYNAIGDSPFSNEIIVTAGGRGNGPALSRGSNGLFATRGSSLLSDLTGSGIPFATTTNVARSNGTQQEFFLSGRMNSEVVLPAMRTSSKPPLEMVPSREGVPSASPHADELVAWWDDAVRPTV